MFSGRKRDAGQGARSGQQPDHLAVGEDMWPDGLVDRRKQPLVQEEAARLATSSIQTEVAHDLHAAPTRAGGQMLQGETPGGERLGDEIDVPGGQELIQVRQHAFFRSVLPVQRSLERQVTRWCRTSRS